MTYFMGRILARATDLVAIVAGAVVTLMMVQVFVDVIGRYVFTSPLPATAVFITHYYMIFVVFLPLAVPERTSGHIAVGLLTDLFPARVQRFLAGWVDLFSAAIYGAMGWAAWGEALAKHRTGATLIENDLALPIWPGYFIVPVGCALMVLVLIYRFLVFLFGSTNAFVKDPFTEPSTQRED